MQGRRGGPAHLAPTPCGIPTTSASATTIPCRWSRRLPRWRHRVDSDAPSLRIW